jgi:hypothetical protein
MYLFFIYYFLLFLDFDLDLDLRLFLEGRRFGGGRGALTAFVFPIGTDGKLGNVSFKESLRLALGVFINTSSIHFMYAMASGSMYVDDGTADSNFAASNRK